MRGSVVSVVLLALAVSSAAPEDTRPSISLAKKNNLVNDGVVDIEALNDHLAHLQDKYARTLATYERNTGQVHPSATKLNPVVVKRRNGTNPLKNDGTQLWYGPISIDSQDFTVDFDTGSSDLFVPGPKCGSSCSGHKIFQTGKAKDTGSSFALQYGDGSTVSGTVYTDSVTVAGLTAKPQALGVANVYSSGFAKSGFPPDGLMGMAWPEVAVITNTVPYFNTLIKNKVVGSGEFGFLLSTKQGKSKLYLGGAITKGLKSVPVTKRGYWQVDLHSVNVGGTAAVTGLSAIIDTGTTLIIGDPKSVEAFYRKVPGSRNAGDGSYAFPCNSIPSVSLTFGGTAYKISADSFNLGLQSPGSKYCIGGIMGLDLGIDAWIAGDVFLTNVYAEFSFSASTVSFKPQT